MIEVEEAVVDRITEVFHHLLNSRVPPSIDIPDDIPDNEIRQLITYVNRFVGEYGAFGEAMTQMAAGGLDSKPPSGKLTVAQSYKALQSNLRHLTWKTQQIASGKLDQTVDFMGEFSLAFNQMTQQLKDSFDAIEQRNEKLRVANRIISDERDKSERLLLNILPARVAEELKESGTTQPQSFEAVTVLFSDIVGFTRMSSGLSPQTLIADLNEMFTRFDEIVDTHGCERIKTIGDAYLAVCGMPVPDDRHAEKMAEAAVDILRYMEDRNRQGDRQWQIRIGMHSGRLVGGVVGVKKYIYDVFGDTINTASRMETLSEPMRINVSEVTRNLLGAKYRYEDRAPVDVKGKGMMKMFFLDPDL